MDTARLYYQTLFRSSNFTHIYIQQSTFYMLESSNVRQKTFHTLFFRNSILEVSTVICRTIPIFSHNGLK